LGALEEKTTTVVSATSESEGSVMWKGEILLHKEHPNLEENYSSKKLGGNKRTFDHVSFLAAKLLARRLPVRAQGGRESPGGGGGKLGSEKRARTCACSIRSKKGHTPHPPTKTPGGKGKQRGGGEKKPTLKYFTGKGRIHQGVKGVTFGGKITE